MRWKPKFPFLVLSTLALGMIAPLPWLAARRADVTPLGPAPPPGVQTLSVVSLNLAKVTDVELMAKELGEHPLLRQADVFLLQEVVRQEGDQLSSGELLARRLGLHCAFASPYEGKTESALVIMSRYPLRDIRTRQLQNVHLVFRSRKRIALAATIETPTGPVRVIDAHLDTRISPKERITQLEPALEEAKSFAGPVILGGDFNTNDMQWVSHVVPVPHPGWQAAAVRKLMTARGFSTPFELRRATFDHLKMQLDWIFTTGFRPVRSAVQPLDFSDHHAIWAEFTPSTDAGVRAKIQ